MKNVLTGVILLGLLSGCASLSIEERGKLDHMADETVTALIQEHASLDELLENSLGYMVVDNKVVKIPVLGGGGGQGVVQDKTTGKRKYVKVTRMDFGGGWGVRKFQVLVLFSDPEQLEQAQHGRWIWRLGAEVSAGDKSLEGSSSQMKDDKGYTVYVRSDTSASVTYTLCAIRMKPYRHVTAE